MDPSSGPWGRGGQARWLSILAMEVRGNLMGAFVTIVDFNAISNLLSNNATYL